MKLNLAVIFGGRSVEHEISVLSAAQAIKAIDTNKYNLIPLYISKQGVWYTGDKLLAVENFRDLDKLLAQCQKVCVSPNAEEAKIYKDAPSIFGPKLLQKIDVAFPVMHGTNGEDGTLQGLLELMNIPYVGCDVLSAAISMDKVVSKMLLQTLNIPVLDHVWFYGHEWINNKDQVQQKIFAKLNYPLIVKPATLGSSIGISSVENASQLEDAVDLAVSMSERVLIEPKIVNLKEVNCSVLGDSELAEVSICEEPVRGDAILSYQDKYLSGAKNKGQGTSNLGSKGGMSSLKRKIPADISEDLTEKIQDLARKAFVELNCSGVARIDFLIDQNNNQPYLCELNTIPGSLAFYLWQPLGKDFTALTERLIELALKRHRERNNLIRSYQSNILRDFRGGTKGSSKV